MFDFLINIFCSSKVIKINFNKENKYMLTKKNYTEKICIPRYVYLDVYYTLKYKKKMKNEKQKFFFTP